eukprot:CAMPEP_0113719712 /NCGR_PEP_ID=MMETSP0038_2-20120614/36003_1 /TAXON_ID=2898 /ORGANISM="Cryptomonas paramecium" /LENGTH=329 /DNA_ID=CAMNT_0000648187 /DNA_START=86 /DNA_END=1078 /DNA_ORIENTATION=- /assembly_acc=CAM_ASM_000170
MTTTESKDLLRDLEVAGSLALWLGAPAATPARLAAADIPVELPVWLGAVAAEEEKVTGSKIAKLRALLKFLTISRKKKATVEDPGSALPAAPKGAATNQPFNELIEQFGAELLGSVLIDGKDEISLSPETSITETAPMDLSELFERLKQFYCRFDETKTHEQVRQIADHFIEKQDELNEKLMTKYGYDLWTFMASRAPSVAEEQDLEQPELYYRLMNFYSKHNESKTVEQVNDLAAHFLDKQGELNRQLCEKYGDDLYTFMSPESAAAIGNQSGSEVTELRRTLLRFYGEHNMSKTVKEVNAIVDHFLQREDELNHLLQLKYGKSLTEI